MSIIVKMLKQQAVYWDLLKTDQYGQPVWAAPIQITCRWEDSVEDSMVADSQVQMKERATVYVSQDVKVGGMLLLGALQSSMTAAARFQAPNVWEIFKFTKLPNLKNTLYLRTAYLGR